MAGTAPGVRRGLSVRATIALAATAAVLAGCQSLEERIYAFGLEVGRSRVGLELKHVEFDDYRLYYLERAGDGETVVLLHGFASEKDAWLRFIGYMPGDHRILAFDLPGHGDSTRREDHVYDVPYMAEQLARGLDGIGVERVHIAGNSLGGAVALVYTWMHPERVHTLGLIDAAGVDTPAQSEFERLLAAGDNPLIVESEDEFARLMDLVFQHPPPMPWPVGAVLLRRFIERSDFHQKMWDDIWTRRREITGLLTEIGPEVIVIWGEADRILDPSSAATFARYLRSAEVYMLRDTGHSPMIERPRHTATLYRDFLARHPAAEN